MKIINLSKRVELQVECHLDNKVGSLSWKFIPFPMIGIKRIGKMFDDEVFLCNGDISIHLMWLFFELTLVIDDKPTEQIVVVMTSEIKWQTEEPKEMGMYLVTLRSGKVAVVEFFHYTVAGLEFTDCVPYGISKVIACCKLDSIEPYKSE